MKTLADTVKEFARNRWGEIIPALSHADPAIFQSTKKKHPCPLCGGEDRFRFTNMDGDGSCICSKCNGGDRLGDGISVLMWLNQESFTKTTDKLKDYLGIHSKQGYQSARKKRGDYRAVVERWIQTKKPGLSYDAIVRNGGEVMAVADQGEERTCIRLPCWNHRRRCGALDIPIDGRPLHTKDGEKTWKKLTPKTEAGWFGRNAIEAIRDPGVTVDLVVVCEGPTDMLAVDTVFESTRYVALSNNFGATHVLPPEDLELLREQKVTVIGDNDEVGRAGAWKRASALLGIAERVKICFPGQEGGDVRDLVAREGRPGLVALLKSAEEITPAIVKKKAPQPPEIPIPEREEVEPIVLARTFVKTQRIVYHNKIPWIQQPQGNWRAATDDEVRARAQRFLDERIEALFADEWLLWGGSGGERPKRLDLRAKLVDEVTKLALNEVTAHMDLRPNSLLIPSDTGEIRSKGPLNWLRFKNGILDVDKLLAGERDYFNRKGNDNWFSPVYLPFAFDEKRGTKGIDIFLSFLDKQVGDADAIKTIQQFFGYCLTQNPSHNFQKFLFFHGEGGTGKSTIIAVARALVGVETGSSVVRLDEFENDKYAAFETYGKLLNAADETGQMDKVRETWVKTFAALETIRYQRKWAHTFQQPPTAKLLIASNPEPQFKDRSRGVWRRMLYVKALGDHFRKEEPGFTNPQYWIDLGIMPAIFNWAIAGLMEILSQRKFTESSYMRRQVNEYIYDSRPEEYFFDECLKKQKDAEGDLNEIYALYQNWCKNSGCKTAGKPWFSRRLGNFFKIESVRRGENKRRVFPNVRIAHWARRSYSQGLPLGLHHAPEA